MKRPLIVGIRPPGSSLFRFRVYGQPESDFPPAELHASLPGLAQWIAHGTHAHAPSGDESAPVLKLL